MLTRIRVFTAVTFGLCMNLVASAAGVHATNGTLDYSNEWTSTASSVVFPSHAGTGGGTLLMEQALGRLWGAIDYTSGTSSISFFNILFASKDGHDYALKVTDSTATTATIYSKSPLAVAPLKANGELDFSSSVWTAVSDPGVNVHAVFGSANPILEFDLPTTLFEQSIGYFISASAGTGADDPPISSAIFQLNPDGSTTVVPALGPTGDPVLQSQSVVPLPASLQSGLALLAVMLAGAAFKQLRKNPSVTL